MELIKNSIYSILNILLVIVSLIVVPKIKRRKLYVILIFLAALVIICLDIDKKRKDSIAIESLNNDIHQIRKNESALLSKIDTALKAHNLKIQGDSVAPIKITFEGKKSMHVASKNQQGGQTAGEINYYH